MEQYNRASGSSIDCLTSVNYVEIERTWKKKKTQNNKNGILSDRDIHPIQLDKTRRNDASPPFKTYHYALMCSYAHSAPYNQMGKENYPSMPLMILPPTFSLNRCSESSTSSLQVTR